MTIYASIITYNPNFELLKKAISAVIEQVDKLIVIDNCSDNGFVCYNLTDIFADDQNSRMIIIQNEKNLGIAEALNQAIYACSKENCDWLLTLDQDSVVPSNLLQEYEKYIHLKDAGQLCCGFVDSNLNDLEVNKMSPLTVPISNDDKYEYYKVYACITSGSLININACLDVGGFKNELFIDYVDYDISLKLYNKGYSNYFISSLKMLHEFGNAHTKRFLWLHYTDYQFSPLRVYYKTRNAIYMMHKYPKFKTVFVKSVLYDFMCIVFGFRIKNLGSFIKGLNDSKKLI